MGTSRFVDFGNARSVKFRFFVMLIALVGFIGVLTNVGLVYGAGSEAPVPTTSESAVNSVATKDLRLVLDKAKRKRELDYTPASWTTLQAAVKTAEAALAKAPLQSESVSSAKSGLDSAVSGLITRADTGALRASIENAESINASAYSNGDALASVIQTGKGLLDNADALQTSVDAAKNSINSAISGLTPKIDASLLKTLREKVDEARDMQEEISMEGAKTLHEPLVAAEKLLAGSGVTKAAVESATSALTSAIASASGTTALKYTTLNSAKLPQVHTQDEIRENQGASKGFDGRIETQNVELTYETQPNTTKGSYDSGKISDASQQKFLDLMNGIRYAAGQSSVHLSQKTFGQSNVVSQDGAQAMAFLDKIANLGTNTSHVAPSQPDGFPTDVYNKAKEAVESNASYMPNANYLSAVYGLLHDSWVRNSSSDSPNLTVGHRMSLLSSSLKGTSIGFVSPYARIDHLTDNSKTASGLGKAVSESNSYIWPAQNTPLEYFNSRTPWTVVYPSKSLVVDTAGGRGPSMTAGQVTAEMTITVESSFGKTWTIAKENTDQGGYSGNKDGFFVVHLATGEHIGGQISLADDIVFCVNDLVNGTYSISPGETFKVTITAPKTFGSGKKIEYQVNFFELGYSKSALNKLIQEAQTYKNTFVVSPKNGADVLSGQRWLSPDAVAKIDAKIQEATTKANTSASTLENQKYAENMEAAYNDIYGSGGVYELIDGASKAKPTGPITPEPPLRDVVKLCGGLDGTTTGTLDSTVPGESLHLAAEKSYFDATLEFANVMLRSSEKYSSDHFAQMVDMLGAAKQDLEHGEKVSQPNPAELESAISLAEKVYAETVDGPSSDKTVSGSVVAAANLRSALKSAIATAKTALGKATTSSQETVNNASETLLTATYSVIDDEKTYVISNLNECKEYLLQKRAELNNLILNTTESNDGSGVGQGLWWAKKGDIDTAKTALAALDKVINDGAWTKENLSAQINEFKKEGNPIAAFSGKRKPVELTSNQPITDAVAKAKELLRQSKEATDASGLSDGTVWATKSARDALQAAIGTAEGVAKGAFNKDASTSALAAFVTAMDTYRSAESVASVDSDSLDAAITAAKAVLASAKSKSADSANGELVVDSSKYSALDSAIKAAETAQKKEGNLTQKDVDDNVSALEKAVEVFRSAKTVNSVDVTELKEKIAELQGLVTATVAADSDANVPDGSFWASQAAVSAATGAVTAANGVLDAGDYTASAVAAQVSALDSAIQALNQVRQQKASASSPVEPSVDTSALAAEIESARGDLTKYPKADEKTPNRTEVVNDDAKRSALTSEIETAEAAKSAAKSNEAVSQALQNLQTKHNEFTGAKTIHEVSTAELDSAIEALQKSIDATTQSTDGTDVLPSSKWATNEAIQAAQAAKTAAENAELGGKYTQKQISDALSTLNQAKDDFEQARHDGTKQEVAQAEEADWKALQDAIDAATSAKTEVDGHVAADETIAKQQSWYANGAKWVESQDTIDTLNQAIETANGVYGKKDQGGDIKANVQAATQAMNEAKSAFDLKVKGPVSGVATEEEWGLLASAASAARTEMQKVTGGQIHTAVDDAAAAQNDWYVNEAQWVKDSDKTTFENVLNRANELLGKKPDPTPSAEKPAQMSSDVTGLTSELTEATSTFTSAVKTLFGLATADDYQPLESAIQAADKTKSGVNTAADLGEAKSQDWYQNGNKWAAKSQMDDLETELSSAKELLKKKIGTEGTQDRRVTKAEVDAKAQSLQEKTEALTVITIADATASSEAHDALQQAITEAEQLLNKTLRAGAQGMGSEGKDIAPAAAYDTFKDAIQTAKEALSGDESGCTSAKEVLESAKETFQESITQVTKAPFWIGTGSEGSQYLEPTTEPQHIWMALVNSSGKEFTNPVVTIACASQYHVKLCDTLNIKAKKVSFDGKDAPKLLTIASYYSDEGEAVTSDTFPTAPTNENQISTFTVPTTVGAKEILFVTLDMQLDSAVETGSVSFNMSARSELSQSTRAINMFYVGRPEWETKVALGESSASVVQPLDEVTMSIDMTQVQHLIPVSDGELEIVVPEGLTPKNTDSQNATYHLKDSSGEDVKDGATGQVGLTWNAEGHKFTYKFTSQQINKPFYKGSSFHIDLPLTVDAGVTGTKTVSAKAWSQKSASQASASADIAVSSPSADISVEVSPLHAQVGDTVTYTVHVQNTSSNLDLKTVKVTPDWQGAPFEEQTEEQSADSIAASQSKDFTFTAKVSESAQGNESVAAKFTLSANNISKEVTANSVEIVKPAIVLERAFVPAVGKGDVDTPVKVRLTVRNDVLGSVAKAVHVIDTLADNMASEGEVIVKLADGQEAQGVSENKLLGDARGAEATIANVQGGTSYVIEYSAKVKSQIADAEISSATVSATSSNVSEIASATSVYKAAAVSLEITDSKIETVSATANVDLGTLGALATDEYIQAGEKIKFSGKVHSSGTEVPENVTIEGTLPDSMTIEEVKIDGQVVSGAKDVWSHSVGTWDDDVPFEVTGTVKEGFAGKEATNKVDVKVGEDVANSESQTVSVVAPALSIERSLGTEKKYFQAKDTVICKTVIEETAENAYATNVQLSDVIPEGLTGQENTVKFEGVQGKKSIQGNTGTFTFDVLKPSDTSTLTYDAVVNDGASAGKVKNVCTVTADYMTYTPAEVEIEIVHPTVEIVYDEENPTVLSASDEAAKPFKVYLVQNTPNATLHGVNATFTVRDGLTIESASCATSSREDAGLLAAIMNLFSADPEARVDGQRVTIEGAEIAYDKPLCVTINIKSANTEASKGTASITTSVSADGVQEVQSESSQGDVTILSPGLNVAKTVVSKSEVQPGDEVIYDVLIQQVPDGDEELQNVQVEDTLPEGLTLGAIDVYGFADESDASGDAEIPESDDLEAGDAAITKDGNKWTLKVNSMAKEVEGHVRFKAIVSGSASGEITNTVTGASVTPHKEASDTATINVQNPSLEISKVVNMPTVVGRSHDDGEGNVFVAAGETFDYEIKVGNHQGEDGNTRPVKNLKIEDTLPDGVLLDSSKSPSISIDSGQELLTTVKSEGNNKVVAEVSELPIGEHLTVHVPCVAKDDFYGKTDAVVNTATYSATNIDLANVTAGIKSYDAELSVTKVANRTYVNNGDDVTYTITVSQVKPLLAAKAVTIEDTLPEGLTMKEETINASKGSKSYDAGQRKLTVSVDSLAEGEPVVISYTATVAKELGSGETLKNNVSVSATNVSKSASGQASVGQCEHQWAKPQGADADGWVIDSDSTCHSLGQKHRDCEICEAHETETIQMKDHNFQEVEVERVEPICQKAGYVKKQKKCQNEGCEATEGEATQEELQQLEHKWDAGVPDGDATCTDGGHVTFTCPGVGEGASQHTEKRAGTPLGHDYKWTEITAEDDNWSGHERVEATCQAAGHYWEANKCSRCGAIDGEPREQTLAQLAHKWVIDDTTDEEGWKVTDPAACEHTGKEERQCTGNGCAAHTEQRDITALQHDSSGTRQKLTDGEYAEKLPTCTEAGYWYDQATCSKCGATQGEPEKHEVAARGHIAGEPEYEVTKEPTCTEAGEQKEVRKCTVCGQEIPEYTKEHMPLDAKGHQWNDQGQCDVCGENRPECEEHQWSEWVVEKEATCEATGLEHRHCTICFTPETQETKALGHDWQQFGDVEHTKLPTCTEAGTDKVIERCQRCNAEQVKEDIFVPALGHTAGEKEIVPEGTKEATCTEDGSNHWVKHCTVCGEQVDEGTDVVPALGHSWKDGKCERCGETQSEPIPPEHEHTWGDWTVSKEPTCTEDGLKTRVCTECQEGEQESIPALGHTSEGGKTERETIVEATCTEAGQVKETDICGRCGKAYGERTVDVAALGHDYVDGVCTRCGARQDEPGTQPGDEHDHTFGDWELAKAPTCTEDGQYVRYCTICQTPEYEVIPAVGHSFKDGICEVCGASDPNFVAEEDQVDKRGLMALVQEVKTLNASIYTTESWNRVSTALAECQSVLDTQQVTQEEVDGVEQELIEAVHSLVVKPATSVDGADAPASPSVGGTGDSGGASGDAGGSSADQTQTPTTQPQVVYGGNTGGSGSSASSSGGASRVSTSSVQPKVQSKMAQTGTLAVGTIASIVGAGAAVAFTLNRIKKRH